MSQSKEFQGRSLDEAIQEACDFYGVPREKLEIEILSDAKSGIFGLVGVKKAVIRASKVSLPGTVASLLDEDDRKDAAKGRQRKQDRDEAGSAARSATRSATHSAPHSDGRSAPRAVPAGADTEGGGAGGNKRRDQSPRKPRRPDAASSAGASPASPAVSPAASPAPVRERAIRDDGRPAAGQDAAARQEGGHSSSGRERGGTAASGPAPKKDAFESAPAEYELDENREDLPEFSLDDCDRDTLFALVREVVLTLVAPIVGPVPCTVELAGKRVRAALDCGEAAGLLVGRDGQTLAAVQYLAARIVSRKLGGAVRLQIDAGKYRERQDDKLRELALSLAAKVRESGRPQSTRPLSAYQRRIVHLALEHEEGVTTRSKGEGPQRRVVVSLAREDAEEKDE